MGTSARFRYDDVLHEYFDLEIGDIIPHITGMLEKGGKINTDWFTEESSRRGTEVHDATASYDLGALGKEEYKGDYRGWFLAHVKAMAIIKPTWKKIEEPSVHPVFHYGGRTDRAGRIYGCDAVAEIKTGDYHSSHGIQTALQAILEAGDFGKPAEQIRRYGLYYKRNGRFSLEEFPDRRDFDEAYKLIRRFCVHRAA